MAKPAIPRRPLRNLLRLLGPRLPRTTGRVAVEGVDERVVIRRDRWGIPHVQAGGDRDAWFALGYCHGQDRGFQLEVIVRAGRGTLAALFGRQILPVDRLSRRLGFRRVAGRQLTLVADDVRATIEAYAAGVNEGMGRGVLDRPHELVLLRGRPSRWRPEDVLAFAGLQAFALAANWDTELARLRILLADGPQALRALDPGYPAWHPVNVPPGARAGDGLDRLAEDLAALRAVPGLVPASNNWALAGSRTASGVPILANDPHLSPQVPAPWYLAHLATPDWAVAGASFVGGPAFPLGHNGHAAWGITAALTDQVDLYLEELSDDGRRVRQGDGWTQCEVLEEQIRVRGGDVVVERVVLTPRGPVLGSLLDGAGGYALSMAATFLSPAPVRGFLNATRARAFEELRAGFGEWPGPALNVAYADAAGHIGLQVVGTVPRRGSGHGMLPRPGWLEDSGRAAEPVPFERMPHVADPGSGWVASANNAPVADGSGPFLGVDWLDGYRAARIGSQLAAREDWTVEATQQLQLDLASLPWAEIREIVLSLPVEDAAGRRAQRLLAGWDGQLSADSPAASLFELLMAELASRVAAARAPNSWRAALGGAVAELLPSTTLLARTAGLLVRLLREQPPGWLERPWPAEAADALGTVARRLAGEHGPDPAAWAWGRLRPLTLRHVLGRRRPLEQIFDLGPVPVGGDANTVAQALVHPLEPTGDPGAIPNVRAVIDLADPGASRFVLAGGQSGNPLSPHYDDQFALWLRGDYLQLAWTESQFARATRRTLVLEPADGR